MITNITKKLQNTPKAAENLNADNSLAIDNGKTIKNYTYLIKNIY
jgi:hypothetical protein